MKKVVLLLILLLLTGCNNNYYSTNLFYMDTVINIKIYNAKQEKVEKAFKEIESIYQKYDNLTDFYDQNSELSKLNNNVNINISDELWQLIKFGDEWYDKSNGLLNINIGALTKVWHDFRENHTELPDVKNIVIERLNIVDDRITNDNVNIDLGAIAKGYVTQIVGEYLKNQGLEYYIINAGGNVLVGKSPKGYYNIGIASPLSDETFGN